MLLQKEFKAAKIYIFILIWVLLNPIARTYENLRIVYFI